MTQSIFRKLFPKPKILNEIGNFVNSGNHTEDFPETISRHKKKVPEKPLSHGPILRKYIFFRSEYPLN